MNANGLSRRELLAGGGALVVAFGLRPAGFAATPAAAPTPVPGLPGSLSKLPFLDGWIRIDANGHVTVFTGKAELGQGIKTALLQVAAEELVVEPARITMVTADTERTADEGYTAGSHSMQDSGTAIRNAAAQVREIVVGLASQRLDVPPQQLRLLNGTVHSADGRSVGYGDLVAGEVLHVQAQPHSVLRSAAQFFIMGHNLPRVDIPAKVTGGIAYVQDVRLPGMLHARVLRPPSPAAELHSLDTAAVEKLPGVVKVVRDGRFVAVVAQREWQAVNALRALAAATQWDERETLPAQATLYDSVLAAPHQDITVVDRGALFAEGGHPVAATYLRPYQLHASIGPSCAVARLADDGMLTIWTHSQGVFPLRKAIAELLAHPIEQVHCIHTEGSGCYGHNAADDVAGDAALLAAALPGRPVRVQWMREDEHMWEPYGPPMVTKTQAALDANGRISSWQFEVWSNPHNARPGAAGDLLAGQQLATPFQPSPPKPGQQPEGAGDRNAVPLYTVPNLRVVHHFLPETPIRTSALRGLGAYMNVFSIESFVDELAHSANADPVAFRLKNLDEARAHEVIQLAAARFGWNDWQRRGGRGRGFAFARYKNLAAYAAIACEVEVRRDTGELRILRVVAAVDSGEVASPDGVRNQIEGGIVQSSSWTLSEEATFDRTRILSRDWAGYPILRFPRVPQSVEVHIVPRPGLPFLGTGEAAQGPMAAALANALFDAGGVRVRQIPFTPSRLRTALQT